MDNYNLPGTYAAPPCTGCGGGVMPVTPASPSQADVANFNYINPIPNPIPQTANQMTSDVKKPKDLATAMTPPVPSLEEIASYNYMSQEQRQQQRQQIAQVSAQVAPSMPGWQSSTAASQALPMVPAQQPVAGSLAPITPTTQPAPISGDSLQYLNGFLRTQIGRAVTVDFLIGTNTMLDRSGILLGVGANYILIRESETDDIVACDFYNIKFVKFYY
jgi:hypothetical protein